MHTNVFHIVFQVGVISSQISPHHFARRQLRHVDHFCCLHIFFFACNESSTCEKIIKPHVPKCITYLACANARYNDMHSTHITRVPPNTIMHTHVSIDSPPLVKLNVMNSMGVHVDVKTHHSHGRKASILFEWNAERSMIRGWHVAVGKRHCINSECGLVTRGVPHPHMEDGASSSMGAHGVCGKKGRSHPQPPILCTHRLPTTETRTETFPPVSVSASFPQPLFPQPTPPLPVHVAAHVTPP